MSDLACIENRNGYAVPVILAYMDEAGGHSYANADKRQFFIRSSVLVSEASLSTYQFMIRNICRNNPIANEKRLPFHAHLIFHGQKGWELIDEPDRFWLLHEMADFIVRENIPFVYGCVNKPGMIQRYVRPINPHILSFVQCGEMVEGWMRRNAPQQRWIPCVGASDHNRVVEQMFVECRHRGAPFGNAPVWHRVADVMAFTSPECSQVFALADMCAFVTSRHLQEKDDWALWSKLETCLYGSRRFPLTARAKA